MKTDNHIRKPLATFRMLLKPMGVITKNGFLPIPQLVISLMAFYLLTINVLKADPISGISNSNGMDTEYQTGTLIEWTLMDNASDSLGDITPFVYEGILKTGTPKPQSNFSLSNDGEFGSYPHDYCYCAAEAFGLSVRDAYDMPYKLDTLKTRKYPQGNWKHVFNQEWVDTVRYSKRPPIIFQDLRVYRELMSLPVHPKIDTLHRQCIIRNAGGFWLVIGDGGMVYNSQIIGQRSRDDERDTYWRYSVAAITNDVKKGKIEFSARGFFRTEDPWAQICWGGSVVFYYKSVHIWEEPEEDEEEQQDAPMTQEVEDKVGMTLESTGRTIGTIAEAHLHNNTQETQTVTLGPWIITGDEGYQAYSTFPIEPVILKPDKSKIIPIPGICIDPFRPPVPEGRGISTLRLIDIDEAFPFDPAASLLERPDFMYLDANPPDGIYVTLPGTDQPFFGTFNFDWAPELSAALIYDIVSRINETVDTLIATEQMPPNPYSQNPEFLAEAAKGQTTWLVISRLLHPDSIYTQEHLNTNLAEQYKDQTGKELSEAAPEIREQFEKGADELFSLFLFVGEEAKVLNTPAQRASEGPPPITSEALSELKRRFDELDPGDPHSSHELERIRKDFDHFGPNPDLNTSEFVEAMNMFIVQNQDITLTARSGSWESAQEHNLTRVHIWKLAMDTTTTCRLEWQAIEDAIEEALLEVDNPYKYGEEVDGRPYRCAQFSDYTADQLRRELPAAVQAKWEESGLEGPAPNVEVLRARDMAWEPDGHEWVFVKVIICEKSVWIPIESSPPSGQKQKYKRCERENCTACADCKEGWVKREEFNIWPRIQYGDDGSVPPQFDERYFKDSVQIRNQ